MEQNGEEPPPVETFGTRALEILIARGGAVFTAFDDYFTTLAALPNAQAWFLRQASEARLIDRWTQIGSRLTFAIGPALAGAIILHILLSPLRHRGRERAITTTGQRLRASFRWLGFRLLPVALFLGLALGLLGGGDMPRIVRLVLLNVLYAIAIGQIVLIFGKMLLQPRAAQVRLLPVADPRAAYLYRWLKVMTFTIVYGYFLIDMARIVSFPAAPREAVTSLLGLAVVVMAIILVVQNRAPVASLLRGRRDAGHPETLVGVLRRQLASVWHGLTILYLCVGYAATAFGVEGGFAWLLRGTLVTLLAIVFVRMALYGIAHIGGPVESTPPSRGERLGFYRMVVQTLARVVVWGLSIAMVFAGWGGDVSVWLQSPFGQRAVAAAFSISLAVILAMIVYETICRLIDRKLYLAGPDGSTLALNPRLMTLLPLLRITAMVVLIVLVGLIALSELGVNIAPLLAGAGIIGVAVGFGSQALVKDFITGLFIVIEDTIHVGDVIVAKEYAGAVESMTIRTLRLRDVEGSLHVLPFGEVTGFTNKTRGFAFAVIDIGVSYDSDMRRVLKALEQIAAEIVKNPEIADVILEPVQVLGIQSFNDYSITLRCRIKTKPGQQWKVRYAFNLQLKEYFDREGIQIPFPTVTYRATASAQPPVFLTPPLSPAEEAEDET